LLLGNIVFPQQIAYRCPDGLSQWQLESDGDVFEAQHPGHAVVEVYRVHIRLVNGDAVRVENPCALASVAKANPYGCPGRTREKPTPKQPLKVNHQIIPSRPQVSNKSGKLCSHTRAAADPPKTLAIEEYQPIQLMVVDKQRRKPGRYKPVDSGIEEAGAQPM
jgi:hypothetical protein